MRTILVICVIGFVLMVASLQADAKRFVLNDRHLVQVKNEPTLGRNAEVLASGGANDQSQSQSQPLTTNKGSSNNDAKHDDDADDDANETYGKDGHHSSEIDSHHKYCSDIFSKNPQNFGACN